MASKTEFKFVQDLGANKLKIEHDPALNGFMMLSLKIGVAAYVDVVLTKLEAIELSQKVQAFIQAKSSDKA